MLAVARHRALVLVGCCSGGGCSGGGVGDVARFGLRLLPAIIRRNIGAYEAKFVLLAAVVELLKKKRNEARATRRHYEGDDSLCNGNKILGRKRDHNEKHVNNDGQICVVILRKLLPERRNRHLVFAAHFPRQIDEIIEEKLRGLSRAPAALSARLAATAVAAGIFVSAERLAEHVNKANVADPLADDDEHRRLMCRARAFKSTADFAEDRHCKLRVVGGELAAHRLEFCCDGAWALAIAVDRV